MKVQVDLIDDVPMAQTVLDAAAHEVQVIRIETENTDNGNPMWWFKGEEANLRELLDYFGFEADEFELFVLDEVKPLIMRLDVMVYPNPANPLESVTQWAAKNQVKIIHTRQDDPGEPELTTYWFEGSEENLRTMFEDYAADDEFETYLVEDLSD